MPAESRTQVVDEHDQPTTEERRRDYVQEKGLWHRIVGVWVVDESTGDMLVQKRQSGRGLDDDKLDSSASGHVDPGEDYIVSGVREAREEIGIDLDSSQLEQIAHFRTETVNDGKILNRFTKVFIAKVGREALKLSVDESELGGVEWLSVEDVAEMVTTHPERTVPGFIIAWYLHNGLPIPEGAVAENNVQIIYPAEPTG